MTTYIDLPDWQDADLLSANRLNAMATNVDVAIGLDEQRVWPIESGGNVLNCGIYSRASDARFGGDEAIYYMAHNGDRLLFSHVLYGVGSTATLHYNNQSWSGLANSTEHRLTLDPLPRYKIVKIRAVSNVLNGLYVRQLYSYQSNATAIGAMPAFTNGTTSSAAHLNTIMAGTKRAVTQLNQPIAGMYSQSMDGPNSDLALATNRNGYYGHIRHKHDRLYLWIWYGCDGYDPGDYLEVTYNGERVWWWSPHLSGQFYGGFSGLVTLPAGLVVGNFYPVEVRMYWGASRRQRFTLWSLYETSSTASASVAAVDRWAHGNTANGSADGPPQLDSMTDALGGIGTLRWTNPACRAAHGWIPNLSGVCSIADEKFDELASVRVHRWLAYESIEKAGGTRAPVTLQYQSGGAYTGITLPTVDTPWYYDLDNTPIKPGMYFRLIGSKFLIQTPGYEGQ